MCCFCEEVLRKNLLGKLQQQQQQQQQQKNCSWLIGIVRSSKGSWSFVFSTAARLSVWMLYDRVSVSACSTSSPPSWSVTGRSAWLLWCEACWGRQTRSRWEARRRDENTAASRDSETCQQSVFLWLQHLETHYMIHRTVRTMTDTPVWLHSYLWDINYAVNGRELWAL